MAILQLGELRGLAKCLEWVSYDTNEAASCYRGRLTQMPHGGTVSDTDNSALAPSVTPQVHDNLLAGTLSELRARERRFSEHLERACEERRLMAAAVLQGKLARLRDEIHSREAFAAGEQAFAAGAAFADNPHRSRARRRGWEAGWTSARDASGFTLTHDPLTGWPISDPRDDEEPPL